MPIILAPVGSSRMFYRAAKRSRRASPARRHDLHRSRRCRAAFSRTSRRRSTGPGLVSALSRRRARRGPGGNRAREQGRLLRARRHHRHGRRRHARARPAQRDEGAAVTCNPAEDAAVRQQFLAKPRWLAGFFRDGGLMKFPNVMLPGEGPMVYADVGTALEASTSRGPTSSGSASVAGKDRRQGRPHRRGRAARGRRGRRRRRRVESRRTTARRRAGDDPRAAGGRRTRWTAGPRCCSTAASGAAATSPRPCASARGRCWSAARTRTGSAPPAEPACTRAIEILRADLMRTIKLLGCPSVAALDRSYVEIPPDWD